MIRINKILLGIWLFLLLNLAIENIVNTTNKTMEGEFYDIIWKINGHITTNLKAWNSRNHEEIIIENKNSLEEDVNKITLEHDNQ